MSETLLIALFSIFGTWCLLLTKVIYSFSQDSKKLKLALELYFKGIKEGAMDVLHSPDNHLGLDYYIDRYRDNNYDLTDQEWYDFWTLCEELRKNTSITPGERMAAAQLLATFGGLVAMHKMDRIPSELKDRITRSKI